MMCSKSKWYDQVSIVYTSHKLIFLTHGQHKTHLPLLLGY